MPSSIHCMHVESALGAGLMLLAAAVTVLLTRRGGR
jgi:hypothetical protein